MTANSNWTAAQLATERRSASAKAARRS